MFEVKSGEEILTTPDNIDLYFCWSRPPKPREAIVIVHGVGDHIDRYEHLRKRLAEAGFACYGYDQRGHGRSGGTRTHVRAFAEYVDDLSVIRQRLQEEEEHLLFLFGHSMGSIVVLLHVASHQDLWRGAIVSGCPVMPVSAPPSWQKKMGGVIADFLPKLRLDSQINPEDLSQDLQVGKSYETDEWVQKTITLRWGVQFLHAVERVQAEASLMKLPLLFLHGAEDHVADIEGARKLFGRVGSKDKTMKEYPALRHELHNELKAEREGVFDDIVQWLMHH